MNLKRLTLTIMAALALSAISTLAQDVTVNGFLSFVPLGGGVYDYTLSLQNTGPEAIESLWLGWVPGSFNIANPTNVGNDLGWASPVVGDSVQYGGSPSETFLTSGATGHFTFDSTSTPADFMSEEAGPSVAYGVNAQQFAIEGTTQDSVEFSPTVVSVPEPSIVGLLVAGAFGMYVLGSLRRAQVPSMCRGSLSPFLARKISRANIGLITGLLLIFGTVFKSQAQTVATGQFSDIDLGSNLFAYTLTLNNTGSTPIETFWFSWVPGEDFMATSPTDITTPSGWTAIPPTNGGSSDGYGIQWKTSSAPLAENSSLIYSFESTVTPSEMAGNSVFYPSTPVGTSFVYSGQPFAGTSDDFVVQPASVPEPSVLGLLVSGVFGIARMGWRRRKGRHD